MKAGRQGQISATAHSTVNVVIACDKRGAFPQGSNATKQPSAFVIPGWREAPGPESITTIVSMDSG
jgi:hypothetical protein